MEMFWVMPSRWHSSLMNLLKSRVSVANYFGWESESRKYFFFLGFFNVEQ